MVQALIKRLIKLDIMGALKVKYFGFSVGVLIALIVVLYMTVPQFKLFVDTRIRPQLKRISGGRI